MDNDNGLGDLFQTMGQALEDGQHIAKEAEEEFKAQCAAKDKKQSNNRPKRKINNKRFLNGTNR